ncbi:prephenate dehydrogenase/arogenate dehydrogenase family protein [Methylicorpusculum sp.]|uniref:prephenate dehydrogenase n=1 Tax=Methylicorpusculum sp. TaxID=2713644 RepID=UPI0027211CFC|nr:prephenate dehydrogenase/arogenate dehydrogenase family protein [Methylicorpusculum sp.]MDO8846122.1 prephenate dehydrogenase/arogenate dehydrogenase family protein [Methylicorpusculum sp.]
MFNRICIIGVGLIGGSIARAAREQGLCSEIIGFGRIDDKENLEQALQLKVIDRYSFDIQSAVERADLVVIATPVGSIKSVLSMLKPVWSEATIYTDVGSTKTNVVAAAAELFGHVPANFVPAHPIAGAEQSGVKAALPDLFKNKRLIITPSANTHPDSLAKVRLFWERLGAVISIMDVEHHDAVLAATSHLPHLLAFALVHMLGRKDEQVEIFKFAAGGFKDFTRIASSDPTMWLDISLANKNQLLPLIEQLKHELNSLELALDTNNSQQLLETFTYARHARQRFLDQFNNN